MKYLVLIPDGMADEKIAALDNMTPMEKANKPTMDMLAKKLLSVLFQMFPKEWYPKVTPPICQFYHSIPKFILKVAHLSKLLALESE